MVQSTLKIISYLALVDIYYNFSDQHYISDRCILVGSKEPIYKKLKRKNPFVHRRKGPTMPKLRNYLGSKL